MNTYTTGFNFAVDEGSRKSSPVPTYKNTTTKKLLCKEHLQEFFGFCVAGGLPVLRNVIFVGLGRLVKN